ncbi:SAM-dependent methyltransferase (plasmid) [Nonomuraea sp. NBC_00507]|uniref:SAM-dependent methyltransferase n=1 Tax=Nonomuraea sp. NBC_00507 TaxID=2976002 RepID=UPI002E19F881
MSDSDLDWASGVDLTKPNAARIYNYFIGGKDWFDADMQEAERLHQLSPFLRLGMRENRHFLRRAVGVLGDAGIRQYLDIGAGLPSAGNVHEVAQHVNPDARVIYVDLDPVVLAQARALTAHDDKVRVLAGDVRDIKAILDDSVVQTFIDWTEPVAVLMTGLLHFVLDEYRPKHLVGQVRDRMVPGSALALSHGTLDAVEQFLPSSATSAALGEWRRTEVLALRRREEFEGLFEGFELLPPGVVWAPQWRPDGIGEGQPPEACGIYVGVGRVPVHVTSAARVA